MDTSKKKTKRLSPEEALNNLISMLFNKMTADGVLEPETSVKTSSGIKVIATSEIKSVNSPEMKYVLTVTIEKSGKECGKVWTYYPIKNGVPDLTNGGVKGSESKGDKAQLTKAQKIANILEKKLVVAFNS